MGEYFASRASFSHQSYTQERVSCKCKKAMSVRSNTLYTHTHTWRSDIAVFCVLLHLCGLHL